MFGFIPKLAHINDSSTGAIVLTLIVYAVNVAVSSLFGAGFRQVPKLFFHPYFFLSKEANVLV
jgi:hypothetical protein